MVKKSENLKKISKNLKKSLFFIFFLFFYFAEKKKKCHHLSFPILGRRNSTRALQSSPFQNPGGVPWAWRTKDEQRKSSCLILDSNDQFSMWSIIFFVVVVVLRLCKAVVLVSNRLQTNKKCIIWSALHIYSWEAF